MLDEGNTELGVALAAADLVDADQRRIQIAIPVEHRVWLSDGHPHRQRLEQLITSICGHCPEIQLQTLYREGQGRNQSDARNQRYRDAQALPLVQDIIRRFDADVVAREPSPRDAFLAQIDGAPSDDSQADG